MRILLDTHILVYLGRDEISTPRKRLLSNSETEIFYSSFSLWEISKLVELKRLQIGTGLRQYLKIIESHSRLTSIPLSSDVLVTAADISGKMHRDPADQIIVASAIEYGARLMTDDERIRTGGLVECY